MLAAKSIMFPPAAISAPSASPTSLGLCSSLRPESEAAVSRLGLLPSAGGAREARGQGAKGGKNQEGPGRAGRGEGREEGEEDM